MDKFVAGWRAEWMLDPCVEVFKCEQDVLLCESFGDGSWHVSFLLDRSLYHTIFSSVQPSASKLAKIAASRTQGMTLVVVHFEVEK